MNETDEKLESLNLAGGVLNSILKGLEEVDLETRKRIMERCGEACAMVTVDFETARGIAGESTDEEEILRRLNEEIPWCGAWTREGDVVGSTCVRCGCPLVRSGAVDLRGTLCLCSRGWVKKVFETLFKRPVDVDLEKAIGFGDEVCKFVVHLGAE